MAFRSRALVLTSVVVFGAALFAIRVPLTDQGIPHPLPEPRPEVENPFIVPVPASVERGRPVSAEWFLPADHGGHRQSYGVVQAPSGLIYVANDDGVLEYDGASWRLIGLPGIRARAVTTGPDGVVYVAGEGTAGSLSPDSTGQLQYREILGANLLGDETVWAVASDTEGVVFQSFSLLLRVRDSRLIDTIHTTEGHRFHKVFESAGRIYVRLEGTGLLQVDGSSLKPVPHGESFADQPIRTLFDPDGREGGNLLAVTDDVLYRLDPSDENVSAIPSDASSVLGDTRAYHGCTIGSPQHDERALAITTLGGGVIVVNDDGQVTERISESEGLTAGTLALGCALDSQGGLWLALSTGILRIDAASPYSLFGEDEGILGTPIDIERHTGNLYVATERGVYRHIENNSEQSSKFVPVKQNNQDIGQTWDLLSTSSGLLAASINGIFEINDTYVRQVSDIRTFALAQVGDRLYAGLASGVSILRLKESGWEHEHRISGIKGEVRSIFAVDEGGAWVTEWGGDLFYIDAREDSVRARNPMGVPSDLAFVTRVLDDPVLVAQDGFYRVNYAPISGQIAVDTSLTQLAESTVGDISNGVLVTTDQTGRVWIADRDQVRAFVREGNEWVDVTPVAFRRLPDVITIAADPDGTTWIASAGDLYRYEPSADKRYETVVPTFVRRITAGDEELPLADAVSAAYRQPLRFQFSAAAYNDPDGTEFRTQLLGHDEAPSAWSHERYRDYTNLPPGEYTFRVEARTAQGVLAAPATVGLTIPAPWYLTPWAYLLYGLGALAVVGGAAHVASDRQRRAAAAERARADELDRLNVELREADKLKDDLLANTSHELRTPLTAILGFSEVLAESDDPDVQGPARHILSGGQRLLNTVNDILEIAQLRAGRAVLAPEPADAAALARQVVDELRPLAAKRELALRVLPEGLAVPAQLDVHAFVRVLTNLVGNGVKFTQTGGVTVTVDAFEGDVHLAVRDTGPGIDADFLPRLFDDFEQASTGFGRAAEGSGLGLAITRRLVDLMGGAITVESEVGAGTTFRVVIPGAADAYVDASTDDAPTTTEEPVGADAARW